MRKSRGKKNTRTQSMHDKQLHYAYLHYFTLAEVTLNALCHIIIIIRIEQRASARWAVVVVTIAVRVAYFFLFILMYILVFLSTIIFICNDVFKFRNVSAHTFSYEQSRRTHLLYSTAFHAMTIFFFIFHEIILGWFWWCAFISILFRLSFICLSPPKRR